MTKYNLIDKFTGYVTKPDVTNSMARTLVSGSLNVIINDGEKVESRGGYELFGAANTTADLPIEGSYEWLNSSGVEIPLRSYDDELEIYYSGSWRRLKDGWSAVDFQFTKWWSSTESIDLLLFVNGDANIYEWSGGITTYSSSSVASVTEAGDAANQLSAWAFTGATTSNTNAFVLYYTLADVAGTRTVNIYKDSAGSNLVATGSRVGDGVITLSASGGSGLSGSVTVAYTIDDTTTAANTLTLSYTITKQGSTSWAAERFLLNGTRQIVIGGITYTYTGGEGTTTITGVTPDPAAGGHTAGDLVFQAVRTNTNKPASGVVNDLIGVLNNQIYIGSLTRNTVYVSKNTDFTDFTYTATRLPGEGALLTLDGTPTAFFTQEEDMYIGIKNGGIFKTSFTLSSDNTKEALTIKKLKTGARQSPLSQDLVAQAKNSVLFVTGQPTLDELGRIENVETPQSKPISDPIKPDFDEADFTNGHAIYWRNWLLISRPVEGKVFIYDLEKGFWQPPQQLPIRRFAVIGGELYGHSSDNPETYKLFTGRNDNNKPIAYTAAFAYRNFGDRAALKTFSEYYVELYMTANCNLTETIKYDYRGVTGVKNYAIIPLDADTTFSPQATNQLGGAVLGAEPLGGVTSDANQDEFLKVRMFKSPGDLDFFEMQTVFSVVDIDVAFQILAHGPNVRMSPNQPVSTRE